MCLFRNLLRDRLLHDTQLDIRIRMSPVCHCFGLVKALFLLDSHAHNYDRLDVMRKGLDLHKKKYQRLAGGLV